MASAKFSNEHSKVQLVLNLLVKHLHCKVKIYQVQVELCIQLQLCSWEFPPKCLWHYTHTMSVTAICHTLQWSPFLVICFDVFFALAHKPFWSILHPNTSKMHLQVKLQEIQWKTKVTQTWKWMAVVQKTTLSPPKNKTNFLLSTHV